MEKISLTKPNKIQITVGVKDNMTMVGSSYSSWDSLFIAIEGVAMLAKECIREGKSMEEVGEKIKRQLGVAIKDYGQTTQWENEKEN